MQDDRRILVVGGSAGIGAALVGHLGERCSFWSRSTAVDVSDPDELQRASHELLTREGPPFGLVHCVGDFVESPILSSDLELFDRLLQSNLRTAFMVVRQLLPAMAAAGRGRVILFAAAGAGEPGAKTRAPLYFAAKAALLSMTRSLAMEVAGKGVTVNSISPGLINHEASDDSVHARLAKRVPLGRAGSLADVLPVIDLLLGDGGAYITGSDFVVDGGLSLRGGSGPSQEASLRGEQD